MDATDHSAKLIGIVDGQPAVVETPIMQPKMRDLTDNDLSAVKLERDKSLDALESVAVKEAH